MTASTAPDLFSDVGIGPGYLLTTDTRCLSLTQPWASLVAFGEKENETRSWKCDYRGTLLIHAAANFPVPCREMIRAEPFKSALSRHGVTEWPQLPRGAIVAVCILKDCRSTGPRPGHGGAVHPEDAPEWLRQLPMKELAFGDYSPRRFAWPLADVLALPEPVYCKGSLSLWTPLPATLQAVTAQVEKLLRKAQEQ